RRPPRGQCDPALETLTPTTYLALQKMSDEEMAWGKRFYMKGAFLDELTDAAVDRAAEQGSIAPDGCSISLWAQGGATWQVAEHAIAFTGPPRRTGSAPRPSGRTGSETASTSPGAARRWPL